MNEQDRGDDQPYERCQNRKRKDSPRLTIAILSISEQRLPYSESVRSTKCEKVGPMGIGGAQPGMEGRQEIEGDRCDSEHRGYPYVQCTTFSYRRENAIEHIVAKAGYDTRYETYESERLVERTKNDAQAYVSRLPMSEVCLLGLMTDIFARNVLVHVKLQGVVDWRGEDT